MPARKAWADLAPRGRTRTGVEVYARKHPELGLTPEQVYESDELRRIATGHGEAPRDRWAALRHPLRYWAYTMRHRRALVELAQSEKGRRISLDGVAEQRDEGQVPVSFAPPDNARKAKTFPDLDGALDYLARIRSLVELGMAWVVIAVHSFDPWIMIDTPAAKPSRRRAGRGQPATA